MIRVVFDTNVLFSAIYKQTGVTSQLLDLVVADDIIPCVSEALLIEYQDVLFRPVLRAHAVRAGEVLDLFARIAVQVSPTDTIRLCSDPDDDCFLECAAAASAKYLVTGNLRHFPKGYKPVAIVAPRELLRVLTSENL
jgi:putative PIN family toxin of toxin-antitoxin system